MSSRSRVEDRAHRIYDLLALNLTRKFTIGELCSRLDIQDGSTTRAAIRRARDLATEAGFHFPPAVPQNDMTYTVTNLPGDALYPAVQMSRIGRGVRLREQDGIEYMRRERAHVPAELRPVVDMHLSVYDAARTALGTIQQAADDMVVALVRARREQRTSK